jgi:predicted ATPase
LSVEETVRTHRFPAQSTSFVGREHELDELSKLVPTTRLLTLAGPGGAGKTRLVCAVGDRVAQRFTDGAWFVDLAPVTDPTLVVSVIASALDTPAAGDDDSLASVLGDTERLVVLDNCEHVLEASSHVAAKVLAACPGVTFVATSREALGVAGEVVWAVPAMRIPPRSADLEELRDYDAVHLFTDRAAMIDRRFELTRINAEGVVRVVERLDGIPLALELAATWTRMLTPDEIATKLDDRFRLLTRGPADAPERHRTLRAAIDWSYELLRETQRVVLGALSVFRGGFTLDAAEAICTNEDIADVDVLEALHDLVDGNLVVADTSGDASRYSMLETIREYADETLSDDRRTALRDKHLEWFRSFARRGNAALGAEGGELWHVRFDEDHDNIREALRWSLNGGSPRVGLDLAGSTAGYWFLRAQLAEARTWLAQLIEATQREIDALPDVDQELLATLANGHHEYARMALGVGDHVTARTAMGRADELLQSVDDPTHATSKLYASVLDGLAQLSMNEGNLDDARRNSERSVEILRSIGERLNEARALTILGIIHVNQGDAAGGKELIEQGKELAREVGDRVGVANATIALGNALITSGDLAEAKRTFEEALALCRDVAALGGVAYAWHMLGTIAAHEGDLSQAIALTQKALDQYIDLGVAELAGSMALWAGSFALRGGSVQRSAAAYVRAIELAGSAVAPWALEGLAEAAATAGVASDAAVLLGAASLVRETSGRPADANDLEMIGRAEAAAVERSGREAFDAAYSSGRVLAFDEAVDVARALVASLEDARSQAADPRPAFEREGEVWVVRFNGRTSRVRDSKGMQHLATLVSAPHREIHALDLVTGPGAAGSGGHAPDGDSSVIARGGDAGEMLDAEARAAYEHRLRELQEEIEEADGFGDSARATRLRAEFDALVDELTRATGLGGRSRKAASESERARLNVQRTLKAAIKRLFEVDRALGRHLDEAVRTGTYCSYVPPHSQ